MNSTIITAIQKAVQLASNNQGMKYNHGAVALKSNRIVGEGINSTRTSWLQRIYANKVGMFEKTCEHAEVAAIRHAKELDTLVVVRVSAKGNLVSSKPCSICGELIKDSGVKHLYYSYDNGIKYERVQ
jgi:tRNA(Arg) A34 adenosine deaminase TadA